MICKLWRFLMHNKIKNYLSVIFYKLGLGTLKSFTCVSFDEGIYKVTTTKGTYNLYFYADSLKDRNFYLHLDKEEFIKFYISDFLGYEINIQEFVINRDGKRQVVDPILGTTKVYPLIKYGYSIDQWKEYKEPIIKSKYFNILDFTKNRKKYLCY